MSEVDKLVETYGLDAALMMMASYVAVCAERDMKSNEPGYSAEKYWGKADGVLATMGDSAFEVGVELVLLKDIDRNDRKIFIEWLKGQGLGVIADENNRAKFRELVGSENGKGVLRSLMVCVKSPVEPIENKDAMFRAPAGYVKLTACAAALQLNGLSGAGGELCVQAEKWVKSRKGRRIIGDYGAIPRFRDLDWYKRLVKAAKRTKEELA